MHGDAVSEQRQTPRWPVDRQRRGVGRRRTWRMEYTSRCLESSSNTWSKAKLRFGCPSAWTSHLVPPCTVCTRSQPSPSSRSAKGRKRAITRTLHDVAAIVSARGGSRRLSHPASHRASRPYRRPQSSSDARRRRWPGSKRRRSYRRALRLEPSRGAVRLSHIASLRGWPHLRRLWPPVEERQRYRELQGAFRTYGILLWSQCKERGNGLVYGFAVGTMYCCWAKGIVV